MFELPMMVSNGVFSTEEHLLEHSMEEWQGSRWRYPNIGDASSWPKGRTNGMECCAGGQRRR